MKKFCFITILFMMCVALTAFTACSSTNSTQGNAKEAPAKVENTAEAQAQPQDAAPAAKEAEPQRDEAAFAKLLKPDALQETAPDQFKVIVKTTKGDFKLELHRDWAPIGVDRFYNLVKAGFFTDIAMFRVVKGFVVQFGIHGSPLISEAWQNANIQDEPVRESNLKGTISFAKAGPNTRTTQLFINLENNIQLDQMGFPPIGKVIEGMDVIESLNSEYSERPSNNQGRIHAQGNAYLKSAFPNLDYILSMNIE